MNDDIIHQIRQELTQLSQKQDALFHKQVELANAHQQKFFLCRWLQGPDPELLAVNAKIEELKEDKRRRYDIIQNAASIPPPMPEVDWSKSRFYSQTLKSWSLDSPSEQLGFYMTTSTVFAIMSKALWRSWNIKKASEILEKGVESDMISFHRHFSGLNNEQLKDARTARHTVTLKAVGYAGLLVTGFFTFVRLKNRNRCERKL